MSEDYGELVKRCREQADDLLNGQTSYTLRAAADAIEALMREWDAASHFATQGTLAVKRLLEAEARADQLAAEDERLKGELAAAEQHIEIVRESRDILHDERDALKAIVSAREDMDVQHAEVIDQQAERLAALEDHERQTHEVLGAILGTDSSLADCAKRWVVRAEQAESRVAAATEALQKIALYDRRSGTPGICPYGCDTPWIASEALEALQRESSRDVECFVCHQRQTTTQSESNLPFICDKCATLQREPREKA